MDKPTSPAGTASPAGRTVDDLLDGEGPVWERINFDIHCSRCGYNLRMLTTPRCPECGLQFDWRTVFDETRWRSDFLFEHHCSRRFLGSYLKTVWRSLRPRSFWRQVSIHDRIHPRPLWLLIVTAGLWFAVLFHGLAWITCVILNALLAHPAIGMAMLRSYALLTLLYACEKAHQTARDEDFYWFHHLAYTGLFATLALLCSLRQTLGRCRIRTVQILRVVAYASTPFSICLAPLLLIEFWLAEMLDPPSVGDLGMILIVIALLAAQPLCFVFFLIPGLRDYLGLPHPRFLAVTSALVGFLFALTLLAVIVVGPR